MRKRRIVMLGILMLSWVCIFCCIRLQSYWKKRCISVPSTATVLGIELVENGDFLQDKKELFPVENNLVSLKGVLLPYDSSSNTLYLSQSLNGWCGELSVNTEDAYVLCAPVDDYWNRQSDAITDGHVFTLWAVGQNDFYEFQLIITGMPVISMYTERIEQQPDIPYEVDPDKKYFGSETLHYGLIKVFNPDVGTSQYELLESRVCYHLKGASTFHFEKKSYSLKLQDYQEENISVSLLGMRADHSWKLNALNTDVNRIREITASQIWEQIDNSDSSFQEPGPRMEYVELLLDNEYKGLYCLVEPIDEAKLELDSNDVLYKIIDWQCPLDEDIQTSITNNWKIQGSVRIRYPKKISDYNLTWYPIRDYLNTFYRAPITNYDEAVAKVNINNLIDMAIFTMATSANDNCYKNTYISASVKKDGTYSMLQVPWDLDYTFGNQYQYNVLNNVHFEPDYTIVYIEESLLKLYSSNPDIIGELVYNRWNSYRTDLLSTNAVLHLLQENQKYIIGTGALQRETARWPQAAICTDISSLCDYIEKRLAWVDNYFQSWLSE